MSLEDLNALIDEQVKAQGKAEVLKDDEKTSVIKAFMAHYKEQSKMDVSERSYFIDDSGLAIVIIQFPETSTKLLVVLSLK